MDRTLRALVVGERIVIELGQGGWRAFGELAPSDARALSADLVKHAAFAEALTEARQRIEAPPPAAAAPPAKRRKR